MNESLKVLKIKIYQPQAHYRIPFTYQRRHTYPIPPYSTFIGLLCNILGIKNENERSESNKSDYNELKKLKIAIFGKFESKTTEYIWFRNLSKDSHEKRFGTPQNRYASGHIEHIGGQMPVYIDILNNVRNYFYIFSENNEFLNKIKESFENPVKRISPLHLGRAEDWIVIEKIDFVELEQNEIEGNFEFFFWIPKNIFKIKEFNFDKIAGLQNRIPTFYKLENGARNFDFIEVKLNDGGIKDVKTFYDKDENLPVFLADFTEGEK